LAAGPPPQTPLGSLQRSPDPLADGEVAGYSIPKNPTPLSAMRASDFEASIEKILAMAIA